MFRSCFSKSSTGAVPKVKDEVVVYSIDRQVTVQLISQTCKLYTVVKEFRSPNSLIFTFYERGYFELSVIPVYNDHPYIQLVVVQR